MDRAERIGLGVAVAAHIALFAVLSFGLMTREQQPRREVVSVTLTDEIGLTATTTDRPAPAAREMAPPEPMAAPSAAVVEPAPQRTVTPTPQPRPTPRRTETRTRPTPARSEPRAEPRPDPPARRRAGSRLSGITEGIGSANDTGTSASQATVSSSDRSNLISRIVNAVRPCYNLGSLSGTSAEDIVVSLRIQPSRNGSLSSSQVSIQGYRGVNGSNREYQRQMAEAARSAVLNPRCPLPNLPDAMYDNGWSDVVLNFIPAQLT